MNDEKEITIPETEESPAKEENNIEESPVSEEEIPAETPVEEEEALLTEPDEIPQAEETPLEKEEPIPEENDVSEEETPVTEEIKAASDEDTSEIPAEESQAEDISVTEEVQNVPEEPKEETPAEVSEEQTGDGKIENPEETPEEEISLSTEETPAENVTVAPAEETPVKEEVKEETKPLETDAKFTAPLFSLTEEKMAANVNASRSLFREKHLNILRSNRVVVVIFMVLAVGAAVGTYLYASLFLYLFLAIIAVFAVTIVYSRLSKKKLNKELNVYLEEYGINTNSYAFVQEGLDDIHLGFHEKMDKEKLMDLDFKENIFFVNSRNLVKGKMKGINFTCADAAYKTGEERVKKSQKTVFVGKVLSFEAFCNDRGRTLLYLKGCGDAAPDKLLDVNEVKVSGLKEDWKVYTSMNGYKSIFSSLFVKALNEFKTNEVMNDVVIAISKKGLTVGLSYCDEFMVIPLEKEFDTGALNQFRNDLERCAKLMEAVRSNGHFRK